jgi:hypothetical protein
MVPRLGQAPRVSRVSPLGGRPCVPSRDCESQSDAAISQPQIGFVWRTVHTSLAHLASSNPQSAIPNPQSRPPVAPIGFVFHRTLIFSPETPQIGFVSHSSPPARLPRSESPIRNFQSPIAAVAAAPIGFVWRRRRHLAVSDALGCLPACRRVPRIGYLELGIGEILLRKRRFVLSFRLGEWAFGARRARPRVGLTFVNDS